MSLPTTPARPLLHLVTPAEWRAALAAGVLTPPSLGAVGFVHLSSPEQVHLPAERLHAGRGDLAVLVLDPDRLGVEVRFEPGVPTDPASTRFPHAYGPVPCSAVLAVAPYRPGPDGRFGPLVLPELDAAGRYAVFEPSLLRRAATSEEPVTGGIAVRLRPFPASHQHNQLIIDGRTDPATLTADADRALAGLDHRAARLHPGALAAEPELLGGLARAGWEVEPLVGMVGPAGGHRDPLVDELAWEQLQPHWVAMRRRESPTMSDDDIRQLAERIRAEDAVLDVRALAVWTGDRVAASLLLRLDGATAYLDALTTDPTHRGRGYGDALLHTAGAVAAEAGCDLLALDARDEDWPRHWYARRGFTEVRRWAMVSRTV